MGFKKMIAIAMTSGLILSLFPTVSLADSTGWKESESGAWFYYTSATEYVVDSWKQIDGNWYYFREDGSAVINAFAFIGGKLYHFDSNGHMEKNKWIATKSWSYGFVEGESSTSHVDWRYLGSDGAAYAGWKKINGSWYYFQEDLNYCADYGLMVTGLYWDSLNTENLYYFYDNGKMATNYWYQSDSGLWYYFGSDGSGYEGWNKVGNKWYFFDIGTFEMITGVVDDWTGDIWFTAKSGVQVTSAGWQQDPGTGDWYYLKSGGKAYKNEWLNYNGKWFYFGDFGCMLAGLNNVLIKDKLYDFDSNGVCKNPDSGRAVRGWQKIWSQYQDEAWCYGKSDGSIVRDGWLNYGGSVYYFDEYGEMVANESVYPIDGKLYSFDSDGKSKPFFEDRAGWYNVNDKWYYLDSEGNFATGWQKINGKWYKFFDYDGEALKGFWYVGDNTLSYFDDNCELVTGWYQFDGKWEYADSNGSVYRDRWLKYNGSWYYFYGWNELNISSVVIIKGAIYRFDESGKCLNPDHPEVYVFN